MRAECERVGTLLVERDQTLQTLSSQSKDGQRQFSLQLALKEKAIKEFSLTAGAQASQLEEVTRKFAEKDGARASQLEAVTGRLAVKETEIVRINSSLREKEVQLERITKSLGWRLLSYYGPIKYKVLLPAFKRIVDLIR
jgi:hypothetical protein